MKRLLPLRLFIFSALLFICAANPIYSAIITSAQSGLFSVGSTWVGGSAPALYDDIVIATGHTVTLDANVTIFNITIQTGAILDNSTFIITIDNGIASGNPKYTNNGTHNGTGNIKTYSNFDTEITGSGITNCTFEIINYGLKPLNDCNLTINGNIQHQNPGNTGMNGKYLIQMSSGNLTINGNLITDATFGAVGITTSGTITVNGNVSMLGSTDSGAGATIVNSGTINISGDLTLGVYASFCQNDGSMIIGGDLLGSGLGDSYFWNGLNATVKLGGNVFPDPFGGLFFGITEPAGSSSTEPNTIEYNGTLAQTIRVPDDAAYSNLIINNPAGATMNLATTVNGFLTVKPGATLTDVSGSLAVTGAFTLQSDATGTGSLITTAATTANVERYIAGSVVANHGWHLLSSPVAAQAISAFHTAGSGNDFYKWNEPTFTWINRTATGGGLNGDFETNFLVGTGYLIANMATSTQTFAGSLNISNVAVSNLSYTGSNAYTGWHLLGNPFSSAIRWNDGSWALSNVDANCQIWNEASASYSVIAANGIIPSTNGFMVHASVNNASLTIPAASRVVSSANWYKNVEQNNQIVLTVNDPEGQTAQPTIIRFDANATDAYDSQYDSYFLTGFAPVFYSQSQQEMYALNTLSGITEGMSIPLGFVKNASNQFNIELTENISGQSIYLTDNKTNQTLLLNDGNYAFTSEAGDNADRFVIHFGVVGVGEKADDATIHAWYANGQLYLQNTDQDVQLSIFDVQGRNLQSSVINSTGLYSQALNLPAGIYMVRLQNSLSVNTVKIIVQ
ncbi:MAG: T9SS type A sorting domain-containing protein [Bacteroidales bacterium]|nr:T9SS type A sorting domain-containing protein [Bacteroidales bacterium]